MILFSFTLIRLADKSVIFYTEKTVLNSVATYCRPLNLTVEDINRPQIAEKQSIKDF